MKRTPTVSSLKKVVWKLFSEYIRRKGARDGWNVCVTCQKGFPWKSLHAGHFIGGRHNSILFDERNVHPQCYQCNVTKHGDTLNYLDFMVNCYGQRIVDELRSRDKLIKQFTVPELQKLTEKYKKKLLTHH